MGLAAQYSHVVNPLAKQARASGMSTPTATIRRGCLIVGAFIALMLAIAAPAHAHGSPDLQLSGGPAPSVLFGHNYTVSLTTSLAPHAARGLQRRLLRAASKRRALRTRIVARGQSAPGPGHRRGESRIRQDRAAVGQHRRPRAQLDAHADLRRELQHDRLQRAGTQLRRRGHDRDRRGGLHLPQYPRRDGLAPVDRQGGRSGKHREPRHLHRMGLRWGQHHAQRDRGREVRAKPRARAARAACTTSRRSTRSRSTTTPSTRRPASRSRTSSPQASSTSAAAGPPTTRRTRRPTRAPSIPATSTRARARSWSARTADRLRRSRSRRDGRPRRSRRHTARSRWAIYTHLKWDSVPRLRGRRVEDVHATPPRSRFARTR